VLTTSGHRNAGCEVAASSSPRVRGSKPKSGGSGGWKAAGARCFGSRSIAACGLPEGALAVGRGGFEVRCLDRVHPLLSSELLHKALALLGDGREKEAASVLRLEPADSPCLLPRTLCAAARAANRAAWWRFGALRQRVRAAGEWPPPSVGRLARPSGCSPGRYRREP
jgi:hypothetical protein